MPHHLTRWLSRSMPVARLSGCILLSLLSAVTQAQVMTDIAPDSTLGTTVTPDGNIHHIEEGTIRGPNQFHSFDRFSVGTNEIASFHGPSGIENIVSRVTGQMGSEIDGTVRSTINGANLFLLNPHGVMFGPHASLEVKGSFYVSTADTLRFADGYAFHAVAQPEPLLTVASPQAFGFLRDHGDNPPRITIEGSVLTVLDHNTLSIVGGDVQMMGGRLVARSGQVHLASVVSTGEVPVNLAQFNADTVDRLGEIVITQRTLINASGASGGAVIIRGGRLVVHNSFIRATRMFGNEESAEAHIDIHIREDIVLTDRARIQANTLGAGDATVRITARSLRLEGSLISASASSQGRATNITVEVQQLSLKDGGQLSTSTTVSGGRAGMVMITATDAVTITGEDSTGLNQSGIFSAVSGGMSLGGNIVMHVGTLTIRDGGMIATTSEGTGQGGTVVITATGDVAIAGSGDVSGLASGLVSTALGDGAGGNIELHARNILLSDGALISAQSEGTGNAGTLTIRAEDTFRSQNSTVTTQASQADGGTVEITAGSLVRLQDSAITARVEGTDAVGGNITIKSDLVLLQGSEISADAPEGRGGNIRIEAGGFVQDGMSRLDASGRINRIVEIEALTNPYVVTPPEPPSMLGATLQYQSCAQRFRQGQPSRFILAGREDRPIEPGNIVSNAPYWAEKLGVESAAYQDLRHYESTLRAGQYHEAKAWLQQARQHARGLPPAPDKAYFLIDIAWAYHELRPRLSDNTQAQLARQVATLLQEAGDLAQASDSPRAASYAWGYLGTLYEAEQQYRAALQVTRRAVFDAQNGHAPESLYRWQWQTGRLLRALGNLNAAIAAYERAIETVQPIRLGLLRQDGGTPVSFRSGVGLLYEEFIDLLLRRAASQKERNRDQYEVYLQQARAVLEQFKDAELRDYFADSCVDAARPDVSPLDYLHTVSEKIAVVYPILLPGRTELLVSLPVGPGRSKLEQFVTPVGAQRLEDEIRALRHHLENSELRQDVARSIFPALPATYLPHAQQLYDWLVRPVMPALRRAAIDTLVFVPDGLLFTIPMAVLHDGAQFLIKHYAVAITPSLILIDPVPEQPRGKLRSLAVGLSAPTPQWPSLPLVPQELRTLQTIHRGKMLLNRDFCLAKFERELGRGRFGIVHIASHGRFAEDRGASFISTADENLTIDRVEQMLRPLRFRGQPLELLTLSACETAVGDHRAVLGLAGMAIRTGAKSALATLWSIQDEATPFLMAEFYRQLQDASVSRAHALRQAQLKLIRETSYEHPYFWAPFLVINNWFSLNAG